MMSVGFSIVQTGIIIVTRIFLFFWELCVFKAQPQDFPASNAFLKFVIAAYLLLGIVITSIGMPIESALLAATVETILLGALSYLILWGKLLTKRWPQTAAALFGSGVVLTLISLPLIIWTTTLREGDAAPAIFVLLLYSIAAWGVAVKAHILRHAMSTSLVVGAALALIYWYISISVFRTLFPPAAGA